MAVNEKKIDIFCKSYFRDFWLLSISLETIKRNVTGYNNVILLIPEADKELFDTRNLPERTLIFYIPEYGNTYLMQQVCKLNAHKFSHADYIMYSDSDCFYDHPINLQDFVNDDKPEILYTDYKKVGDAIVWQKPTSDLMGEHIQWEFMRRHGNLYHRSTLIAIDKWKPNLESIIMGSQNFSEFNLLGAWANKYEKEKYTWTNTDEWEYVRPSSLQVWSHSSKSEDADKLHLVEYIRLLESVMTCFNVPVPKP